MYNLLLLKSVFGILLNLVQDINLLCPLCLCGSKFTTLGTLEHIRGNVKIKKPVVIYCI